MINESKTWPHVLEFALIMEAKLGQNRHKGDREGWLKDSPEALVFRMRQEVVELCGALMFDKPDAIISECADVANFAMMVADVVRFRAQKEGSKR